MSGRGGRRTAGARFDDLLRSIRAAAAGPAADDAGGTDRPGARAARRRGAASRRRAAAGTASSATSRCSCASAIAHLARQDDRTSASRASRPSDDRARPLGRGVDAPDGEVGARGADAARGSSTTACATLENRPARRWHRAARARHRAPGRRRPSLGSPPLEDFDYLAFEDRFRGPEEVVRERQAAPRGPVRRHRRARSSTSARPGRAAGAAARARRGGGGRRRVGGDGRRSLAGEGPARRSTGTSSRGWRRARRRSLGGIVCSHVVEHLWPADHVRLRPALSAAALRPGRGADRRDARTPSR